MPGAFTSEPTLAVLENKARFGGAIDNGGDFRLAYGSPALAAEQILSYAVERSIDLGVVDDWDSLTTVFQSQTAGWITYRSTLPRAGQLREFLRVTLGSTAP